MRAGQANPRGILSRFVHSHVLDHAFAAGACSYRSGNVRLGFRSGTGTSDVRAGAQLPSTSRSLSLKRAATRANASGSGCSSLSQSTR